MNTIAIDGPSGVGKTSVSRRVAHALAFTFITSGALYRIIGLYLEEHYGDITPEIASKALPNLSLSISHTDNEPHYAVNGIDYRDQLLLPKTGSLAAAVSCIPEIRALVNHAIQTYAKNQPVVTEGRDASTNIFPDATLKVYMDADPSIRAHRRALQLQEKGEHVNIDELRKQMHHRDEIDKNKGTYSLRIPEDAFVIDTSHLNEADVAERIVNEYYNRTS